MPNRQIIGFLYFSAFLVLHALMMVGFLYFEFVEGAIFAAVFVIMAFECSWWRA